LLDERNRVASNLAPEAHKTRRTGVNDQIGPASVRVEGAPADQRRARTTKLDAVSLHDLRNRMLLAEQLGINAFCYELSHGHGAGACI
jgi:hypothetical protein